MPSETDQEGHGAACGRGVYTTKNFEKAVQYAISHILGPEEEQMELAMIKVVLLVGIPGHSAPLQGRWEHNPQNSRGHKYELRRVAGSIQDLLSTQKRGALPAKAGYTPRWTIWNAEEEQEETSGIAMLLGFFLLLLDSQSMLVKRHVRGKKDPFRGFLGWDLQLEPPFARPRDEPVRGRSRSKSRRRTRSASAVRGAKSKQQARAKTVVFTACVQLDLPVMRPGHVVSQSLRA